jgi:hypothetical protein
MQRPVFFDMNRFDISASERTVCNALDAQPFSRGSIASRFMLNWLPKHITVLENRSADTQRSCSNNRCSRKRRTFDI